MVQEDIKIQNQIKVILTDNTEILIDNNTPDLNELVECIINNREYINVENIKVYCELDSFDSDGFTEIIKLSVEQFLNEIELDKQAFKTLSSQFKNKKDITDISDFEL